jgi:hypothetical protein
MYKGSQKETKEGAENQGVDSSLFSALFRLFFFLISSNIARWTQIFLDLHPFCMLKLKRRKKNRRKTVGIQKREKKGSEKGREKG